MDQHLVLWSTVVGFALPPVLAAVVRSRWRAETKGLIAFLACLVAAAGTVALQGKIGDGTALTTSALLVFTGAAATYRLYWHPSGIAPTIEARTNHRSDSALRSAPTGDVIGVGHGLGGRPPATDTHR